MSDDLDILSDAEIIAGMYESIGGDIEDAIGKAIKVRSIDYKRWGQEAAAATEATFDATTATAICTFNPVRTFKPFGMVIVQDSGDEDALFLTGISISGVDQLTTKNRIPARLFAADSLNVPKLRYDTVQTSPGASLSLAYTATIVAPAEVKAIATFSGIALQR